MIRAVYIFFIASLFISPLLKAQVGSPYSQYGAGDLSKSGFGQSQAMGGVGIGLRTNKHLNDLNPAAYSALDSNAVIYEMGISGAFNKIENITGSDHKTGSSIDYLGFGIRAWKRWYTGFTIATSSKIDYILKGDASNEVNGQVDIYYSGKGGLNKIYWANGIQVTNNLSLGFNLNYNFGSINRVRTTAFYDDITSLPSKVEERMHLSGFSYDYGLQYSLPFEKNRVLTLGVTYANSVKINTETDTKIGTVQNSRDSNGPIVKDLINGSFTDVDTLINGEENTLTLPQKVGVGISFEQKNKLLIAADFTYENTSKFEFDRFDNALNDQFRIAAGGEFTPDHQSITSYFKRVNYRLGGHFHQSHIRLFGQNINDYGVSLGFGFPLRKTNTTFNITFELGQRGTTEQNLIKETYGIISLNLSLSDIWFVKRKYN